MNFPQDDLIRLGGTTDQSAEQSAEQNQAKGKESLEALKSLFA